MSSEIMSENASLEALAEYSSSALSETIPTKSRARVGQAISDCLAVMVAGTTSEIAAALTSTYPPDGGSHYVMRVGNYESAATAALVWGTLIHALDFDDAAIPAYTHPGSHLVAGLLAIASEAMLTGEDLIRGYRVGLQIENTLGELLNPSHYQAGWHATGTLGPIATTGAIIAALRVSKDVAINAFAISASMAGGVRANFGTMTKPLHAGLAARAGVESVFLALGGYTGSPTAMDAKDGYFAAYRGSGEQRSMSLEDLRRHEWAMTGNGLMLKLYPSCAATHTAIDAALELRTLVNSDDQIVSVEIGVCEFVTGVLRDTAPADGLQAKFSNEYCIAAALVRGEVTMESFSEIAFAEPAVQELAARMTMRVDPELANERITQPTMLHATTSSGRVVEVVCRNAKGTGSRWPTLLEQQAKWRSCATWAGLSDLESRTLIEILDALPTTLDAAELIGRI